MMNHQLPPPENASPEIWAATSVRTAERGVSAIDDPAYQAGASVVGRYWDVVYRHIWTILAFLVLGVIAGILWSRSQIPLYETHALIEIRVLNGQFLNLKDVTPVEEWNMFDDVQTQIRILQS